MNLKGSRGQLIVFKIRRYKSLLLLEMTGDVIMRLYSQHALHNSITSMSNHHRRRY